MVDDALTGGRLIGMIQPTESEDTVLRPKLSQIGCAGRIISYRETEDNRYLITLAGHLPLPGAGGDFGAVAPIARWRAISRLSPATWRRGEDGDFPRERLLAALKDYLSRRDMKADWKSVMTAPAESLVNALAMMCPFEPAEKQALLEAPKLAGAGLHPGGAAGNRHAPAPGPGHLELTP